MDFEDQLEKAIARGQQRITKRDQDRKKQSLNADDLKRRHNEFRLHLSDHIENSLNRLAERFPGFEYEIIYGTKGWGWSNPSPGSDSRTRRPRGIFLFPFGTVCATAERLQRR